MIYSNDGRASGLPLLQRRGLNATAYVNTKRQYLEIYSFYSGSLFCWRRITKTALVNGNQKYNEKGQPAEELDYVADKKREWCSIIRAEKRALSADGVS
ncbi:MAG: hypothetical protein U0T82_11005 [Bacteroidales bacterium]